MTTDIKKVNLKKLSYSPDHNPLLDPQEIRLTRRKVYAGRNEELVNSVTGEVTHVSAVVTVEDRDDESFVKVFAAGVAASYELSRTGQRVFQAILYEYERSPMRSGFAEYIELFWFNDQLCGRTIDMSEKTFQRGLKELLELAFLSPRTPTTFWVNPALFFKGDRVRFIKEYRRRRPVAQPEQKAVENKSEEQTPNDEVSK